MREYRPHLIGVRKWRKLAAAVKVDEDRLAGRVSELAEDLPDALADACRDEAVAALNSPLPARLLDLVTDRAATCRGWLDLA